MTPDLTTAVQEYVSTSEDLSEALASAEQLKSRLTEGDATVTAQDVSHADAAVYRARLLADAASVRLRNAEDAEPLPSEPRAYLASVVTRLDEELSPRVAELRQEVESATGKVSRFAASLRTAEEKLEDATANLQTVESQLPRNLDPGLVVANRLIEFGTVACDVEVTTADDDTVPQRGTLPLLRIIPTGYPVMRLEYLTKLPSEEPPSVETVRWGLAQAGFKVRDGGQSWDGWEYSADGDTQRHVTQLCVEPRPVAVTPCPAGSFTPKEARETLAHNLNASVLPGVARAVGMHRTAVHTETLGGITHNIATAGVPTFSWEFDTTVTDHAIEPDGLHRLAVGARVTLIDPRGRNLSRTTEAQRLARDIWQGIVGAGDWDFGVVVDAEPVNTVPDWAGDLPARDGVGFFAELVTVYRLPFEPTQ